MFRVETIVQAGIQDAVEYRCAHCQHRGEVFVAVVGTASYGAFSTQRHREKTRLLAEREAHRKLEQLIAIVRCPACKVRDPVAARRTLWRRLGPSLGIAAIASILGLFVAGELAANPLIGMAIAAAIACLIAWPVLYKLALRRADSLRFLADGDGSHDDLPLDLAALRAEAARSVGERIGPSP